MCNVVHARFWIVMADRAQLQATVRHTCREDAKREALRLASEHRGLKFFVAAITGVAEYAPPPPPEANWTELRNEN